MKELMNNYPIQSGVIIGITVGVLVIIASELWIRWKNK